MIIHHGDTEAEVTEGIQEKVMKEMTGPLLLSLVSHPVPISASPTGCGGEWLLKIFLAALFQYFDVIKWHADPVAAHFYLGGAVKLTNCSATPPVTACQPNYPCRYPDITGVEQAYNRADVRYLVSRVETGRR